MLRRRAVPGVLAALAAFGAVLAPSARAAWPLPPDAPLTALALPANWPPDPDYGPIAAEQPGQRQSGHWPLFSFLPPRSPGADPVRSEETSAGMAVDAAWRRSRGDRRVQVAILDSGIDLEDRDLVDRVALNLLELAATPPLRSDGTACADIESGAGPSALDCNDDGVLSVADFAADPRLEPSDGAVTGDVDGDGRFGARDLLRQAFVNNGTDDDGNGLIDDVAGWDFVADDNDPFDDLGGGRGTLQARRAVGTGSNGFAGIGACPRCRLIPIRVAADLAASPGNAVAGLLYAGDRGARVALVSALPSGRSSLVEAAIAHITSTGTLVVGSLGDDDTRTAGPLDGAPAAFLVSGLTMAGNDATTATSFFAFNRCSGFGPRVNVTVPSEGCGEGAAAVLAGSAALVQSHALALGFGDTRASLDPEELAALLMASADDVDVPESRDPGASTAYSQAGFDQRFGAGRPHIDRALERLEAGLVPPVVAIDEPGWFSTPLQDGAVGSVAVTGRVRAPRAERFDVRVAVAGGPQPASSDFVVLRRLDAVPGGTVAGADGEPLAAVDLRSVPELSSSDPDGRLAEDDATLTVRITATATYGDDEVTTERRRTIHLLTTTQLVGGRPFVVGAAADGARVADLDGDGVDEVVVATGDGQLQALRVNDGAWEALDGFPFESRVLARVSSFQLPARGDGTSPQIREAFVGVPAIGDLDGDGAVEVVVASREGTLYVIAPDGSIADGWPRLLGRLPGCENASATPCTGPGSPLLQGVLAGPTLADLDGDGSLEVIQPALDAQLHIFHADGTTFAGSPLPVSSPRFGRGPLPTEAAVGDLDGDGAPEIVVGSTLRFGSTPGVGAVTALEADGSTLPGYPVTVPYLPGPSLLRDGTSAPPTLGDVDGDGALDLLVANDGTLPRIVPALPAEQSVVGAVPPNALPDRFDGETGRSEIGLVGATIDGSPVLPFKSWASLGDLDGDGRLDVAIATASDARVRGYRDPRPRPSGVFATVAWSGHSGEPLASAPLAGLPGQGGPALADVDGDGFAEVITGDGGGMVTAVNGCGVAAQGWPRPVGAAVRGTPAVGDVDGDGQRDVIVTTAGGAVLALTTDASVDAPAPWPGPGADARGTRTVGAAPPLTTPLTCDDGEGPPPTPPVTSGPRLTGGCQLHSGPPPALPTGLLALLVAGVAGRLRRPRRGAIGGKSRMARGTDSPAARTVQGTKNRKRRAGRPAVAFMRGVTRDGSEGRT